MNRADLQLLSEMRLTDAKALLASGNACGAYYLAGYSLECALKACIARRTAQYDFPDKKRTLDAWEHVPAKLIKVSELQDELDSLLRSDTLFREFWDKAQVWSVDSRYDTTATVTEAESLIRALDDPEHGVLQWLHKHW